MKRLALGLALCTLLALPLLAAEPDNCDTKMSLNLDNCGEWSYNDDYNVRIDHGDIILIGKDRDRTEVVFTKDNKLLIDGREIELNDRQQELVNEYHQTFDEMLKEATQLGIRGAAIGVGGAMLGMQAMGGLVKAALTSYELEDLEDDLDAKADELQEVADQLEEDAKVIESMADDLDDIRYELAKETPELKRIRWF